MNRRYRLLLAAAVGLAVFSGAYLFLTPHYCAEALMSSWSRCVTVVGSPAFSLTDWGLDDGFDVLVPVVPAALATAAVWWLLGRKAVGRS